MGMERNHMMQHFRGMNIHRNPSYLGVRQGTRNLDTNTWATQLDI
jgi:hypothetical protein